MAIMLQEVGAGDGVRSAVVTPGYVLGASATAVRSGWWGRQNLRYRVRADTCRKSEKYVLMDTKCCKNETQRHETFI
jgi:hypothetical protein